MRITKHLLHTLALKAAGFAMLAMVATGTWAQDTTITTVRHGEPSFDTKVKNAEVVYVEGNDLVLRLENGKVEHLIVPDSDVFTIDGKDMTVRDLVPGTKLTQTITTSTAPRYVQTVQTVKGKIWHVSPPNTVILTLPDHTNKTYTIPNHAKFSGERKRAKSVFDLRKGMTLEATIVTDNEHTVIEESKTTVGEAPLPATPREVGMLLFFHPSARPAPPAVMSASLEQPADELPKTGSLLPLVGLLGALGIATSLTLGTARRALVQGSVKG